MSNSRNRPQADRDFQLAKAQLDQNAVLFPAGSRPLSDVAEPGSSIAWAMVEASPDALVMVDGNGLIELANRQTEKLFGYDRGELLGRPVEVLLPERFAHAHTAHRTRFRAAPAVRAMGSGMELFGRHADGTEFPVEISLSPLHTNGQQRVIAAVRDISERTAAEAFDLEIRHSLDVVEDGVFMFAVDTLLYRYVNQGAIDQTGYGRNELLAMTPLHLNPEFTEASFRQMIKAVVADEVPSLHFTTVHRHKSGTDIPVEVVLQVPPLERLSETRTCVALVRDISKRLETEQGLVTAQRKASVLEDRERIGRDMHDAVLSRLFATGMSVQATIGRVADPAIKQRLSEVVDEIDFTIKEIRTTIFGIRSSVDWGERLRGQILAVAAGKYDLLGFEPGVNLAGPVDDLPHRLAEGLLATMGEALTNVGKHAQARSVTVSVEVTRTEVTMNIADDGVGFTPSSTNGNSPLSGHGLANMVTRAETLKGKATISSIANQGTTLNWTVPLT